VIKQAVENLHVPRPAGEQSSPKPRRSRGNAAFGGMPGAFCSGIVKNQQGSAAELLQIGRSENFALLYFSQFRGKSIYTGIPHPQVLIAF
jgi:hypothetical protein